MAFLQIRLLGRPEISHEDQPVSDDLSAKAIALLAYLLAGPEGGSTRDELSGLFWGDADEEHANYYLRRTLWALRKALNHQAAATDTYICFYEGRYFFQTGSDYWLDLSEFQRVLSPSTREFPAQPGPPIGFGTPGRERVTLAAGLALYRGKFLQGLHLRGYAGVMDWIDYCRDKLEKLYVGGLRALALEEASLPNQGGAIAAYEQVVALDPLDEDAVSGLMVAYYNAGAREKALERYRSFQRALRQQLELEPLP